MRLRGSNFFLFSPLTFSLVHACIEDRSIIKGSRIKFFEILCKVKRKKKKQKKKKHFRRKRKRRNEKEKEKEEEEKDGRRKSFTNLKLSSVGCARALERIDFVLCQILSRYFHALSAFELSGQTLTNFSVLHENTKSRYDW